MRMIDVVTLALAKKYVKQTLAGAGALQGEKGESAYDLAVKYGYTGTEQEWLMSLIGKPGSTPYVGQNLHWWIDGQDTGTPCVITNYNDLENKPQINGVTLQGNVELDVLSLDEVDNMFR